jgi:hypothetical protein
MERLFSLTLILFLSAALTVSCKKNNGEPPVLPVQETMIIDFSNFTTPKKSADLYSGQKGTENSNWEFTAGVVTVWRLLINTTLIVPVTSFKLAADQSPVFLSEKTWQWSYNFSVAGVAYKARLTGQISPGDVLWKMYITREGTGGFAEFAWFEGTSKPDGTGGQWIFKGSSLSSEAILQIDWTKNSTSIGRVKYKFVKEDTYKNNYIEYGLTTGTLNAYYTIQYFNGVKLSDVFVEWNSTTHNGRVKCLEYLSDNRWYCWNEQKINITCPQ